MSGTDVKKYPVYICSLVFGLLFLVGSPSTHAQGTTIDEADLVHFGDVIDIDVVGGFEFDWRGRLTPEGFLDGLIGIGEPVFALCRSEEQIAEDISRGYSKFLRDPKVIVKVIDRSDRALVRLDGAVRTPSRFRIRRKVRLRELLVLTGGLIDSASGEITIFRPKDLSCVRADPVGTSSDPKTLQHSDNTSRSIVIKVSELLKGIASANPEIVSGDLITVLTADPVYVIGAVNGPRPIPTREKLSLSRVIAMAGGLAKNADGGKVTIFRREGAETKAIETELGKIKNGELTDEVLQPFDIIDVVAKGGQRRKFPPVAARDESRAAVLLPLRVID
ncbi:MAG: SLBB domain-containing protein [Pyrinomonadaceae bacterium]